MSIQDLRSIGKQPRWVAAILEKSPDLLAIGGAMIGAALVVGIVIVGLHERQTSFRAMAPVEQGESTSYR